MILLTRGKFFEKNHFLNGHLNAWGDKILTDQVKFQILELNVDFC